MILIGGLDKNSKRIADAGIHNCENCNNVTVFEVRQISTTVSLFFLLHLDLSHKIYVVCPVCDFGYELSVEDANALLHNLSFLPSADILDDIFKKTMGLHKEFMGDGGRIAEWDDYAKAELLNDYELDHVEYVLSCFNKYPESRYIDSS